MSKKARNSASKNKQEKNGDNAELIIEGVSKDGISEKDNSPQKKQAAPEASLNLTLITIFIDILIGISANIATNTLPNALISYTWLAWFILPLLILVYFFLVFRATKKEVKSNTGFRHNKLAKQAVKQVSPRRSLLRSINDFFLGLTYRYYKRKYKKIAERTLTLLEEYSEAIKSIELAQNNGELSKEIAENAVSKLRNEYREKLKGTA